MPGAPDHKKKVDLEEYLELNRKWQEINWQKELEERRAAASENTDENGSNESEKQ